MAIMPPEYVQVLARIKDMGDEERRGWLQSHRTSCSRSKQRSQSYSVHKPVILTSLHDLRTHHTSEPPTLTTEIGLQVIPMGVVTSWTTTPMEPKRVVAALLFAAWTDWQHCSGPVEHEPALPSPVPSGAGVATARITRVESVKSLVNIVSAGS